MSDSKKPLDPGPGYTSGPFKEPVPDRVYESYRDRDGISTLGSTYNKTNGRSPLIRPKSRHSNTGVVKYTGGYLQVPKESEFVTTPKSGYFIIPPRTQAMRIFHIFGGARPFWRALQNAREPHERKAPSITQVYRWNYPRDIKGGSGGVIPAKYNYLIQKAALLEGLYIPPEDFTPVCLP